MNRRLSFLLPRVTVLAAAACVSASPARGAQLSFTPTAPVPGTGDVANLTGSATDGANVRDGGTYANGGANDAFTYVAFDRRNQGQTFTTGSNASGYGISAIWIKHAGYSANTDLTYYQQPTGSVFTIRLTDPSLAGAAGFALDSETYTITGAEANKLPGAFANSANGTGTWFKFTFDTPVNLAANKTYGFDLTTGSAANFFEWAGTETDATAGGNAYQGALNGNAGGPDNAMTSLTGDRVFMVDLTPLASVPVINPQPENHTGFVGTGFSLVSGAVADPLPTFQWQFSTDGSSWADIEGQTGSTYQDSMGSIQDNGFYRMIASNGNSTISNVVTVSLSYPPPSISQQPLPASVQVGSTATFSVTASGIGSLSYQWYKGVDPIPGETTDTLVLTNVQESAEGGYHVRITDDAATFENLPATTVDSSVATLDVFAPPSGLISHEPFDTAAGYTLGELPAQNPAVSGYTGAWTDIDFGDAEAGITAGSLVYADPLYLGSSGDKASVAANSTGGEIVPANSGRVYRLLGGPLQASATTSGVRYLSFLFQSGQETGATIYQTLSLNAGDGDANRNFDIGLTNNGGLPGTAYGFGVDNAYTSTGVAATTGVRLLVVKFDLSANAASDSVTVWVDPVPGNSDPAGGIVIPNCDLTWDRLVLSDYDGNSAAWDEIRWGTTFPSVTLKTGSGNDYASWIAGYPAVGAQSGFDQDADGDGIKNGLENFFGTNPAVFNAGLTDFARSGSNLTFRHPKNASPASDVTATYRWSTDLVTYHDNGTASGGTTVTFTPAADTPVAGTTTVTASLSGTIPPKLFMTVRVVRSAP